MKFKQISLIPYIFICFIIGGLFADGGYRSALYLIGIGVVLMVIEAWDAVEWFLQRICKATYLFIRAIKNASSDGNLAKAHAKKIIYIYSNPHERSCQEGCGHD